MIVELEKKLKWEISADMKVYVYIKNDRLDFCTISGSHNSIIITKKELIRLGSQISEIIQEIEKYE